MTDTHNFFRKPRYNTAIKPGEGKVKAFSVNLHQEQFLPGWCILHQRNGQANCHKRPKLPA